MSNWTGYTNRLAVGCDLDLNRNPTHDDPNVAVIIHTYAATNYSYYNYDVGMAHSGDFGSGSTTRRMVNSQAQEFDGWNSWFTAQYGRTQYLVLNLSASGTDAGPVSGSWGITIPARPYAAPAAPTGLSASRVSDAQVNLAWTDKPTTGEPYSAVLVERRESVAPSQYGPWQQIASLGATAASYSDRSVVAARNYNYRVRAQGAGGTGAYTAAVGVSTTPNPPTNVTAAKQADGSIVVGWANATPYWGTGYQVLDNGTQVASVSNETFSWTHLSPDPATPHTYTVRMLETGGLVSADSAPSPTIQLLTPPSAPTLVSPNGTTIAAEKAVVLTWRHNPVDSTAQTSAQVRWRKAGVTSWTTVDVAAPQQLSLGVLTVGGYEWQARTRGLYHPSDEDGFGPWSPVGAFSTAATPAVVILTPANLSTVNTSILAITWSYYQAAGHGQVSWEAELADSLGAVLETKAGANTATASTFAVKILDGQSYGLRLRARSSDGLWSAWTNAAFSVSYPQPPTPDVTVSWDEDLGTAVVAITNPEPLPAVVARTNQVLNPRGAGSGAPGWSTSVAAGYVSSATVVVPPGGGVGSARRVTLTAVPTGGSWFYLVPHPSPSTGPAVTPGVRVSAAMRVWASRVGALRIMVGWRDSAGAFISWSGDAFAQCGPDGEGTWMSIVTGPAPAGAARCYVVVGWAFRPDMVVGDWIQGTQAIVEVGRDTPIQPGDYFDGASGPNLVVDGQSYAVAYTGTPNASTSTMTPNSPPTLTNTVERSVDGGSTWEPVADNLPLNTTITDPECLVGAQTLYRVTAISSLPSSAATIVPFTADSRAMWLTAGPGFRQVVRLPYNPSISISPGLVERTVQHFAGRTLGTEMAGTARSRTITIGSLLIEADPTSESSTSADAEELAYAPAPILYRDPTGRRIYTSLSSLSVKRDHLLRWTLSATLEEVGRD